MYKRILVAIENSDADRTILTHVRDLARLTGGELLLVHVADGWAARHFDDLQLRESEEMRADREYLARLESTLRAEGFPVRSQLAKGDPATELLRVAQAEGSDLIAMATHGHRFLADVVKGTTVDRLRHLVKIPVLLLRAH
jgi:nucleotide-binding universal stress UspA family protein